MAQDQPKHCEFIYATALDGTIGTGTDLPWHLPEDLKRFRRTTQGRIMIMGRKTFDTIKWKMPDREHIVLTRDVGSVTKYMVEHSRQPTAGNDPRYPRADYVTFADSLELAMMDSTFIAHRKKLDTMPLVIGGAEIFKMFEPHAVRCYRTLVHARPNGAVKYDLPQDGWETVGWEDFRKDDNNEYDMSFSIIQRRGMEL